MSNFDKVLDFLSEMNFRLDLDPTADRFRKKAYATAADSIREAGTLEDLSSIKGVGKSIKAAIEDVIAGQTPAQLAEMRKNGPPASVISLTKIRGIGPKGAIKLWQQGIDSMQTLEKAIHDHRIIDPKLIANYYSSIAVSDRVRRDYVATAVAPVLKFLKEHKSVIDAQCMGSFRRHRPDVRDVDVLVTVSAGKDVAGIVKSLADSLQVKVRTEGPRKSYMDLSVGGEPRNLDLNFCLEKETGCAIMHFTGSKDFNVACRTKAEQLGYVLNQYCFTSKTTKEVTYCSTEREVFDMLQLPYVPPECRDHFTFQTPELPTLIDERDIIGDFHVHTKASDGLMSESDAIKNAKVYGYKFIGISDHSKSSGNGLDEEYAVKRSRFLRSKRHAVPEMMTLSGVELDVKMDGSLDYSLESLSNFDYVLLSCHLHHDKDIEERMTKAVESIRRVLPRKAIAWAHPTGRLIGSRAEASIDWGKIFKFMAMHKVAIEINGQPSRLDLPTAKVITAKKMGCKFILSSDCHSAALDIVNNAVMQARRALLSKADIVNGSALMTKNWLRGEC
jgi:DNA polymerase (family 10)